MRKRIKSIKPTAPLSISKLMAELADCSKSFASSNLAELSNLVPAELEVFKKLWPAIGLRRRQQIVYRLVELAEDNCHLNFDNIFKICLTDHDAEVRSQAIEGLWENEETSLINSLIHLLNDDISVKVQEAAATALGKFALLAEYGKLRLCHSSKISMALLRVVDDISRSMTVRSRALEAMGPLSLPQVEQAITKAYRSHNSKIRASAVYAMGKNCSPSWLPILLRELDSESVEVRYEAASACGELGEEEAVPHLIRLITDTNTDIQLAVIQALGKIGGTKAKECLKQCLDNSSEIVRHAAEESLCGLEAEETPFSFSA